MKRLYPVLIILCVLGAVFSCLPQSQQEKTVYTSLEDLKGCTVGIQSGTNYERYLAESCPEAVPVFFNEFPSIYPALQQGKIDVMLSETISFVVEKMEIPSLEAISEPVASLDIGIGVCQNSRGNVVYPQLNDFIAKMKEDGTMEQMTDYWFTDYDRENATVDKTGITGENGVLDFAGEASFEPMCFAGEGGELTGYDVDFIYRFCREYGYEPRIKPLEYDAMTAALASGKCTVAVGVIPDEERAEEVRFTQPFLNFYLIAVYDTGVDSGDGFLANLAESFEKTFVRDARWKMFLQGVGTTLLITVLSVLLGTGFGLAMYLWCAHGKKAERAFADLLCWVMSGTPTVVLLMILYYIVFGRYLVNNIAVAVVGFTLMFGCGFYELVVSGIKAVGTGQKEAARAQGFSQDQTFWRILLPQAAGHFLPGYQGAVISLIQETSVVGYIAVMDLTKMSDLVRGRTCEAFFPLLATAGIYFLLIWLLTAAIRRIADTLDTKKRKKERILKDIPYVWKDQT